MHSIWKFTLELQDVCDVSMPAGAEILSADVQRNELCLWALCDTTAEKTTRRIRIVGTGNPFPEAILRGEQRRFIATTQMPPFVWHVFEELQA